MQLSLEEAQRLLAHDVGATLGTTHVPLVEELAARIRKLEIQDHSVKLVDDVQQYFHDRFVDTTWPACPRHPNHPLSYDNGEWLCPRDRSAIARLGELDGAAA